jgi:uncharacterized protein (TIGR03067 family)
MLKQTALILLAGLLLGAGDASDAARAELKKLQGSWKVVSLEMAGKPLPAEKVEGTQITFKDDLMTISPKEGNGNTMPVKLDPAAKPKAIDLTITRGVEKISWKCIYSLEGDILKFVMPLAPAKGQKVTGEAYGSIKRPESFDAKDKPFMVFTAKRQKD